MSTFLHNFLIIFSNNYIWIIIQTFINEISIFHKIYSGLKFKEYLNYEGKISFFLSLTYY